MCLGYELDLFKSWWETNGFSQRAVVFWTSWNDQKKTCPYTTGWSISSRHIKTPWRASWGTALRLGPMVFLRPLSEDFQEISHTLIKLSRLSHFSLGPLPYLCLAPRDCSTCKSSTGASWRSKSWFTETGVKLDQGTRDDERCLNARVIFKFLKTSSFLLAKISHLASRSADAHGWALCGICAASIPRLGNSPTNQADRIQPAGEATKQTT